MLLSYNEDEDNEQDENEEYYDDLESDSWSSSVIGTWKDLE